MTFEIRAIAKALGGNVTGRFTANVPGPGHSKTDRSLSVTIRKGRICVHSHAGNDWKDCRDYVMSRLGLEQWRPGQKHVLTVASSQTEAEAKRKLRDMALKIWSDSVGPRGTLVEQYLREHRGLTLPADIARTVIRFHGSLWVDRDTRLPGMVCLFRSIKTNEPCGIHRTFLDRSTAQKIDRKMLGIAKGAAIKFDAHDPVSSLVCGEGIETCLTAREAGFGRAWALGSSGAVKALPVLTVTELLLLQENDATSKRDTAICAKRYLKAGKPVTMIRAKGGNDLNDVWRFGRKVG